VRCFKGWVIASLVAAALVCWPSPARAQLIVTGFRDLAFGPVIPGVTNTVAPSDPVKSGEFQIQAALGTRLRLDFILPTVLIGPSGATMPINFQNNDALLIETGPGAVSQYQNPKSMKPYTMLYGNRLLLFLGGSVTPAGNQANGPYANTVNLTVTII
jgi:hypothetical protein